MKPSRVIVTDYIKGKITYAEGCKRLFALDLPKKERIHWFNNLRSVRDEFIDGGFYPANLHMGRLTSW